MASVADEKKKMTVEEFLALPDDGVERWLINGELREGDATVTVRNWLHSSIMARLSLTLGKWWERLESPRGVIVCGEAGVRLVAGSSDTVGVDVAYVSPEVMARQSGNSSLIEGVPELVVEILSPSDKLSDIEEKINMYLAAGVPLVWSINPMRRTATVYRPSQPDRLVHQQQSLSGEEVLPGLSIPLHSLFE